VSTGDERLLFGAELFDRGQYFEAHEAWEEGWRLQARDTASADLFQGLAQCAAAAHKLSQGKLEGARSLARKGMQRVLRSIAAGHPSGRELALEEFMPAFERIVFGDMPMTDDLPRLLRSNDDR
jgi:predicted metal-dependent hydrolase